ncbi:SDR family oxidoreductase [Amycolatopsis sp. H6(2020)]|nr:SDR family oxidoreductase [Amycolatopsis sp. H6(2020)]
MTTIAITGGAGFLGSLLTRELLDAADAGEAPLGFTKILSVDLRESPVEDPRVESVVGDFADPEVLDRVITEETAAIYHLAAVLSGGSAEDFDLAMRVNVDGTRRVLEAARATGTCPMVLFTSSLAVFGGEVPEVVPGSWAAQPASTYGAFKAIGELLVNEYSRKEFVDGRVCRMPTISVRPGKPNSAASSFASGIIREPLQGVSAPCPVPRDTRLWLCSPTTAVRNLAAMLSVPGEALGSWRVLDMPGISVTVQQMLDALEAVAGADTRDLVYDEPDPRVAEIVCSWPGEFDISLALGLGLAVDEDFADVVRAHARLG